MSTDSRWLDSMPEVYDRLLGPALFAPFARDMAIRVARLLPARVLELAAGTGILTRELLAVLPEAQVVATDLNEAMAAWGAQQVPDARWRVADAQQLDLPSGAFDVVVCQFGAMFFPDRVAAHREAARVLAPGGTLAFSVWDVVEASDFPAALTVGLAAVLPGSTPDFLTRIPHGYTDPALITSDLVAGGLQVRSLDRVRLRGSAPSASALAEGFCLGTPLRFALQERGSPLELTHALAENMTEQLGEGPVGSDLTAWVVTAQHPR
jgi:SAM-dependent methyltransferase